MFRSFRRAPLLLCLLLALALTACRTQMSLTYQIDNGEQIKVELNSSDGHKLSQEEGLPPRLFFRMRPKFSSAAPYTGP